uniref:Si:ch73-15b2.5 n=1 Tax=Astyanax mexicanus TaxID=7994 RepID=A0A3B1JEF2_ASTMX
MQKNNLAVGLFQSSTELKATLPPLQTHVLFSNLKEVCKVSEGFLLDLETRLGQNVVMSKVGDIVLNHRSAFRRVYVPYVTNMMYQEALIAKLLLENKRFALTVKKLEKDPVCQRQTLKSFLVLPFQRITRLKLILESRVILPQAPQCRALISICISSMTSCSYLSRRECIFVYFGGRFCIRIILKLNPNQIIFFLIIRTVQL